MKSSALGSTSILAGTMLIPWVGAWVLDVDLDLASTSPLPSGKVTPNIGDATLAGTIDASATGRFGEKARARIVGGAGAWSSTPSPKHFHSDAGVLSSTVIQATASEIGETANDANPITYPADYVRLGRDPNTGLGVDAPASRVFGDRGWYVDANGVTQVADWPVLSPSADVSVLDYDPEMRRLTLSADSIVWPGTVFTDSKFGTLTVRDVEISIAPNRFRITAWCAGSSSSRLQAVLRGQIREYAGIDFAKLVRYRISVVGVDGRLQLDAVDQTDGFPSMLPLEVWPGMAGFWANISAGTEVLVEFVDRDPSKPKVRGFAPPSASDLANYVAVALAPLVDARISAIVSSYNTHIHGGGTISGSTDVPKTTIPPQDSVAAKMGRAK